MTANSVIVNGTLNMNSNSLTNVTTLTTSSDITCGGNVNLQTAAGSLKQLQNLLGSLEMYAGGIGGGQVIYLTTDVVQCRGTLDMYDKRIINASNVTASDGYYIGTTKQTATYTLPDTSSTAQYISIGTWTTSQTGRKLRMSITSANGYDGLSGQTQCTELVLGSAAGAAPSAPNYMTASAFVNTALGTQLNSPSLFKIVVISQTQYAIYGNFGTYTGVGSFYTLSIASGDTWSNTSQVYGATAPTGTVMTVTPSTLIGPTGTQGSGFSSIVTPGTSRILIASNSSTNTAIGQSNLTFDGTTLGVTGNETITTGTTTTKITSNLIVAVGSSSDNALYGIVQTVHPTANTGGVSGGAQWSYSMIQNGQRVYGMGLVPNANGRIIIGMGGNATGTNGLTVDCDNTRLGIGQESPAYTLDVNGTGQFKGVLRITETTGTTTVSNTANTQPAGACNVSVGSLTISHANNPGQSSIVFPHSSNTGSDYGYITYMDDVSNTAGQERSRLLIGAQNDPTNPVNSDAVVLQPFAGYVGVGQLNPAYTLDVNGVARSYACNAGGVADGSNIVWGGGSNTSSNTATYSLQTQGAGGGTVHQRIQSRYDGQYGLSIDSVGNSVSNLLRIVDGGATGSGVGIGTATVAGGAYALQVAGGLTVDKGFRPSYSNVTSGTSITASSNYGTHYDIQTSAITGLTISYPAAGSNNWSNDSNGYWVFRNNTGSYLSLAITYTAATPNIYPSNVTIPPANSVTLMASYPGGGTNSNYVLF